MSYPILLINSEHGSGKTTLTNFLKALIDPDRTGAAEPFKDIDALYATAASRHVVALDNLSKITAGDSDSLCRIATGAGRSKKQLYKDNDPFDVRVRRPMILNGISFTPDRTDLLDRGYLIGLLPLTTGRRLESELKTKFEKARPGIFGALLSAVSAALREGNYNPVPSVRMADAAAFIMKAEKGGALPWTVGTFERLLTEREKSKQHEAVTSNPIGYALLELANQGGYEGYQKALFDQVRARVGMEERVTLPKSDKGFGAALVRLTPMLRGIGIALVRIKREFGQWVTLAKMQEEGTGGR